MKKNIVITGGSDGLGKSIAKSLSAEDNVIILATNEEKLKNVAKGIKCHYRICDVRDYKQVSLIMNEIIDKFHRIDVLINNAGIWIKDELDVNDSNNIQNVMDINLLGTINCAKAVIPYMKKQKSGLIININSQNGIIHKAERTVYTASKWGVTGFSRSLQAETSKYGIRVSDVMPGLMKTNMFKKMNIEKDLSNGLDTKEVARLIKFIIDTPDYIVIPEVGIKHINN